ncbi:23S rRNA (guanosine(2251)-2'-O)-methyltransferase RlmB [Natroniella sulfidigena]|uniref:23S rRNA (guanosine(2251)-2'-O)-methyltransferase RlmB n=1 Tax=Natroniella sulfidigena TaxID=723921 RepID=UPI00200AE94F|nr:23S rRNA (guanosine(2251)-2'-O)-methyltransferase RlmB [Natroniella sulfidigena]MCK8816226.1 23S rRNA (guanosine(2251)-2'-O)-methyltransferase RlmB [Natroniella sulfidigena]
MAKIEGRNPVIEALKAGRRIEKIMILKTAQGRSIEQIEQLARQAGVHIEQVSKHDLTNLADSHAHQGVIAFAEALSYWKLEQLISHAKEESDNPLLVLLDELKDPHNFGAILRSANAAGAQGVIIPSRRSVGFSPVVAKASAGAVEYLPVAQVTNLSRTIERLKEEGFWIAGADIAGEQFHYQADLTGSLGLVIGSEGSGLRRLVKEKCDFLVRLPMEGQVDSLNASVAAGILLYEAQRQQKVGN